MPRVVIIGGGISGLALAFHLQKLGPHLDIQILEKADRPGGKIGTIHRDGFLVEVGPNGFLGSKSSTLDLCEQLGLSNQLVSASPPASRNRYLFVEGGLRRLPAGVVEFLCSNLLSWRGKLDLVQEVVRRTRKGHGDESIAAFARRRIGPEATRVLVDAIVTGIHAGDPELLSMAACFPRYAQLERDHGSVIRGLLRSRRARDPKSQPRRRGLWSLANGLGSLIDALSGQLRNPPMLGISAKGLRQEDSFWLIDTDVGPVWRADAVVLACPANEQAGILAELDDQLAQRVGTIAYNRIAVVALGYRRADVPMDVSGFGYIAPQRNRRDVLGVQWCSSIYPGRAPEGAVLLRAMAGGWHRPDVAAWDDDRLLQAVRVELRLAMGVEAAPIFHHVIRWQRAIPQYLVAHQEHVAWIQQRGKRYPGLFLAGNAYHGVAMNDCTEQAELLAKRIASHFKAAR